MTGCEERQRCEKETPWCYVSAVMIEDGRLVKVNNVERCLVPELMFLWGEGVETLCSCCGHGDDAKAYITVKPESAALMEKLGYERCVMHRCLYHPDSVGFRARRVSEGRARPAPEDKRTIQEIRRGWAASAGLSEQEMEKYV